MSAEADVVASGQGTIVVFNRDLFFGVRIGNQLRALGYEVVFANDAGAFVAQVRAVVPIPVPGVLDMDGEIDWPSIQALVADPAVSTPLLAFGSHLDVAGRRAAKRAGVDRIVSNGEFHRDLVGLVRRYARST